MSQLSPEARTILLNQLVRFEDYRQYPYRDTEGHLTIGIGRNLDSRGITKPEALYLCNNDIDAVLDGFNRELGLYDNLDTVRKIILANMGFNLGVDGVMKFKHMLAALEAKDYKHAAMAMLDSKWQRQVGNRALYLAHAMENGKFDVGS